MELKDYYAIMGVKPTDDLKTIKTAYRRLARKYHPDVSKEPDAEARFKEVAEAWEVLSDEQRRAEYDQMWQHRNDPQFNRQFHHGDLWLVIHIAPHPLFDIVGQDLEIVVPVSPWEAALGTKVTVPTLKESILLTIPPGSQAGQRLRVKGKGLVSKKQTGDLYAVLKIVMPPKPDENTAALWQQLADAQSSFDPRKDWGKA